MIYSGAIPSESSSKLNAETPKEEEAQALGNEAVSVIPYRFPAGSIFSTQPDISINYAIFAFCTCRYSGPC